MGCFFSLYFRGIIMSVSKIIEIFQDILDQEKGIINLKTTPTDIDEWDSVANINIIVSLEDEFGIKFKLKDVQEAKTVQDFVELVEAYKK